MFNTSNAALKPLRVALPMAGCLLTVAWGANEAVDPGIYEITAETLMPHLEDNLHYAIRRERRCLRGEDLPSIFPILRHESLKGCKLGGESRRGDAIRYLLACEHPEVATGTARLDADSSRIKGLLEVKMGGKNMTFSQRIEATRLGDCELSP